MRLGIQVVLLTEKWEYRMRDVNKIDYVMVVV